MRRLMRCLLAIVLATALGVAAASLAEASPKGFLKRRGSTFNAGASSHGERPGGAIHGSSSASSHRPSSASGGSSEPGPNGPLAPNGVPYLHCMIGACQPAAPVATVAPETVARAAVARLQLAAPTPTVGPPPSINRWKMAAVGYPLWLWVEGNTSPSPVTVTNGPLSVSLRAHVTGITFDMGDGHTVSCTGGGSRWTRDVAAGTPSPTCGYRYRKPSLPDGSYTITATTRWAVDWNINGTTGTIPYSQTATTSLPVGELQVLVR